MSADLSRALPGWQEPDPLSEDHVVGVLPGEGIGPDCIRAALQVLEAVAEVTGHPFRVETGGPIGREAEHLAGTPLPDDVVRFCDRIFSAGGALLCGPGGGRFVYELRSKFDLYCKLVPLRPLAALADTGALRPAVRRGVDVVIVRENVSGLYLGEVEERRDGERLLEARQSVRYDAVQVDRILRVAANLARLRAGRLHVVVKPGGVPAISELWRQRALDLAREARLDLDLLEIDNACYQIVADPGRFDVIAAPNMFGDVLGDTAALLLGSRGMSHSANYGDAGIAVYQTGHGAAYDLASRDVANPVGQILSLAMMMEESFGLSAFREAIERAANRVLAAGWRTADVMAPGCRRVGTRELGERIAEATRAELGRSRRPAPGDAAESA